MTASAWSVSGVREVVGAFGGGEVVEEGADASPGGFDGALGGLAQKSLQLGEDLLDGVQVWAVGRQEDEVRPGAPDGLADGLAIIAVGALLLIVLEGEKLLRRAMRRRPSSPGRRLG